MTQQEAIRAIQKRLSRAWHLTRAENFRLAPVWRRWCILERTKVNRKSRASNKSRWHDFFSTPFLEGERFLFQEQRNKLKELKMETVAKQISKPGAYGYNLIHSIEGHDFEKVSTGASEIVSRLRTEILDVRAVLERVGRTENIDEYIGKFEQYRKIIEETIAISQRAERLLENPETRSAFERSNIDISFEGLCGNVNRVRQVLQVFIRLISELVGATLRQQQFFKIAVTN